MPQRLIVNTSPLIFRWRVSGLAWLAERCNELVLIPEAVVSEIRAGHDGAPIVESLKEEDRLQVAKNAPVPPVIAAWDLGPGTRGDECVVSMLG